MNPLFKIFLKLLSSPKIDMQEDYLWIRKMQEFLSFKPRKRYQILDQEIYAEGNTHNIPVRIFYPQEKRQDDILLFFHGGGWVLGNIDTYTNDCIRMAEQTGRIVLSVDYRKAPEYPFPAGFNDCYRVAEVLLHQLELTGIPNVSQLNLIGDSAGGNLVAAVSLRLREEGKTLPRKQILINPVTYWDHTSAAPFESIEENGYDYGLTSKKMQEYMEMYEPDEELRKLPYISPLMAENLSDQPDTLLITAEFDPLRDEGEAYGRALADAGNRVKVFRMYDTVHNFITGPVSTAPVQKAYQLINEFLAEGIEEEGERSEEDGKQNEPTPQEMGAFG